MAPTEKNVQLVSATSVPNLLMRHVGRTAKSAPAIVKLQESVAQITVQTQLSGASMLHITLIDPYWEIMSSGMLDVNADGLLDEIEVNYPDGSHSWWRLTLVDVSSDLTGANLTLTFEDRIVAYLRTKWGPKVIAPKSTTRAQFVKQLVDEVGKQDGLVPIRFVCPSLNVVQPIDLSSETLTNDTPLAQQPGVVGSPLLGPPAPASALQNFAAAKVNKARGTPITTTFKIKGQPATPNQIQEANTLLGVANSLKAGTLATQALLCAAIGESTMGGDPTAYVPNSKGYWGILQGGSGTHGSAPNFPDPHDSVGMATSFLLGGKGFQGGGAIALSKTMTDPGAMATKIEGSGAAPSFYGMYIAEADAIIAAGGGVVPGSQNAGTPAALLSDVAQLSRGGAAHPDEDSWDCINRLAQEVNFFAFSNADVLYYMDGPDLTAQKPSLLLNLKATPVGMSWTVTDGYTGVESIDAVANIHGTFDNSAFTYRASKITKGQPKRKTRGIARAATPSEIKLDLVCDIIDYRAGDLFKITGAGPLNGRWIVSDATRNVFTDTFTQFTLVPPTAPLPEPSVASTAAPGAPGTNPTGIGGGGPVSNQPGTMGYVNPLGKATGVSASRIDMGCDYTGNGAIVSMGNGTVYESGTFPGWQNGNPPKFVGITLTDGPRKGQSFYVSECIQPTVAKGATVTAGQQIATFLPGSIEMGWASGSGDVTYASASGGGYTEGHQTAAGTDFNKYMVALGAPSCHPDARYASFGIQGHFP